MTSESNLANRVEYPHEQPQHQQSLHSTTNTGDLTTTTTTKPMSRHAHFDCFSGIAGDMVLAACLDMGGPPLLDHVSQSLQQGLPALRDEFTLSQQRVWRGVGRIAATHVTVQSVYDHRPAPVPSHSSHDHSHGHGHSHNHYHHNHTDGHSHAHGDGHASSQTDHSHRNSQHGHDTTQQRNKEKSDSNSQQDEQQHHHNHHHGHSHNHDVNDTEIKGSLRNLPEIRQMLQDAPPQYIPRWVKRVAITAFTLLAQAEAHVHGADSPDAVHFHEVGAVDSIVDTVGSLLALHALGVTTVSCSALPLGTGTVRAAHGLLPVPAPATLFLLQGLPVTAGPPGVTGELVTPTGAALLRALLQECETDHAHHEQRRRHHYGGPPRFTLRQVGVGAGTKDFVQHPNILRIMIGDIP